MFFINNVLMKPDNIEESVELLDDNIIIEVSRPFPNIDVVPERDRVAITLAIVAHIVNKSDMDYGQDNFRDSNRFDIMLNLVGRALAKEINVRIPMDTLLFLELFKALMKKKFAFLFGKASILMGIQDPESVCVLNNELKTIIKDNSNVVVSAYTSILNR